MDHTIQSTPSAPDSTQHHPPQAEQGAAGPAPTPRLLRRSAVRAQKQGDIAKAKTLHLHVIDTGHPVVAPASMLDLGQLLQTDGDTEAAARLFEQAIESGNAVQAATARAHLADREHAAQSWRPA